MEEQGKAGKNGEREKVRQQESKRRGSKSARDEERMEGRGNERTRGRRKSVL